jgi:hypothetical protein
LCIAFCVVGHPSKRFSKITEAEWEAFIKRQNELGHGWALNSLESFKHLIAKKPATDNDGKVEKAAGDDDDVEQL